MKRRGFLNYSIFTIEKISGQHFGKFTYYPNTSQTKTKRFWHVFLFERGRIKAALLHFNRLNVRGLAAFMLAAVLQVVSLPTFYQAGHYLHGACGYKKHDKT
jgi:hypothetical protein